MRFQDLIDDIKLNNNIMKELKTLNLGKIKIHVYPADRFIELGIAIGRNFIEIQLLLYCIEIDW